MSIIADPAMMRLTPKPPANDKKRASIANRDRPLRRRSLAHGVTILEPLSPLSPYLRDENDRPKVSVLKSSLPEALAKAISKKAPGLETFSAYLHKKFPELG